MEMTTALSFLSALRTNPARFRSRSSLNRASPTILRSSKLGSFRNLSIATVLLPQQQENGTPTMLSRGPKRRLLAILWTPPRPPRITMVNRVMRRCPERPGQVRNMACVQTAWAPGRASGRRVFPELDRSHKNRRPNAPVRICDIRESE